MLTTHLRGNIKEQYTFGDHRSAIAFCHFERIYISCNWHAPFMAEHVLKVEDQLSSTDRLLENYIESGVLLTNLSWKLFVCRHISHQCYVVNNLDNHGGAATTDTC